MLPQEIKSLRRAQQENESVLGDLRREIQQYAEDLEKETQRSQKLKASELQLKAQFQKILMQLDTDQLQRCARVLNTAYPDHDVSGGDDTDDVERYKDGFVSGEFDGNAKSDDERTRTQPIAPPPPPHPNIPHQHGF